jgi:transcriptional regulator with XRE-family HTH domain
MNETEIEYLKKVGANIKAIRISKNIKQVELARLCNYDRQNMYSIETGKHNLTLLSLKKIATALSVKIKDLTI